MLKEVAQTDKEQDRQTDKRQESLERQVQVLLSLHSFWINKPQVGGGDRGDSGSDVDGGIGDDGGDVNIFVVE